MVRRLTHFIYILRMVDHGVTIHASKYYYTGRHENNTLEEIVQLLLQYIYIYHGNRKCTYIYTRGYHI